MPSSIHHAEHHVCNARELLTEILRRLARLAEGESEHFLLRIASIVATIVAHVKLGQHSMGHLAGDRRRFLEHSRVQLRVASSQNARRRWESLNVRRLLSFASALKRVALAARCALEFNFQRLQHRPLHRRWRLQRGL